MLKEGKIIFVELESTVYKTFCKKFKWGKVNEKKKNLAPLMFQYTGIVLSGVIVIVLLRDTYILVNTGTFIL